MMMMQWRTSSKGSSGSTVFQIVSGSLPVAASFYLGLSGGRGEGLGL